MYLCLHMETAVFVRYCYIFSLFLLFCGGVSLQEKSLYIFVCSVVVSAFRKESAMQLVP